MAAERRAAMRAILRIRSEHSLLPDDGQGPDRPIPPSPKRATAASSSTLPPPHAPTTAWTRDEVVSVLRRTFDVCREARSGAAKNTVNTTLLPEIAQAHVHGTAMITAGLSATAPPQASNSSSTAVAIVGSPTALGGGIAGAGCPKGSQQQAGRRKAHRGGTPPSLAGVPNDNGDGGDSDVFIALSRAKKLIATQRALQRSSKRSVLSSRGEPSFIATTTTVHSPSNHGGGGGGGGGVSFARMPVPPLSLSRDCRNSPSRNPPPEFALQFPADFERLASRSPQAALRKKANTSTVFGSPLAKGKLHRGSQLGVGGVIPGSELVRRTVPLLNGIDSLALTTTGFRLTTDIASLLRTISSPRDDPLGG